MVWHQKVLLPSHENVVSLCKVRDGDGTLAGYLLVRPESAKLGPVADVHLVVCAPVIVLGEEVVFCANDFSLEIGGQCWVVLGQSYPKERGWLAMTQLENSAESERQTLDAQVAAEKGFAQVNMLDLDLDVVDLSFGLLCAAELASRSEEG